MAAKPETELAGVLFRYTLLDSFRLTRMGTRRLIAMGVMGAVGIVHLERVYASVLQLPGGRPEGLSMVLAAVVGVQGLLLYLGFTWLMGSLYFHRDLESLLILPVPERLVALAFFLPVLLRAYLLEGILAGPMVAAFARVYGLAGGEGLRLTGLLVLLPPLVLGVALLLLLFVMARTPGGRHVWAAAVYGTVLLALGFLLRRYAGLATGRLWHATASPSFWVACLGMLALTARAGGKAVAAWWRPGRERLLAGRGHAAGRRRSRSLVGWGAGLSVPWLVRRELAYFFSIPVYVTNYLATAAVGTVISLLVLRRLLTGESVPPAWPEPPGETVAILAALLAVLVQGLMPTTSLTAFSRDGQEWWSFRLLPIPLVRLVMAKLIAGALLDLLAVMPALIMVLTAFPLPHHARGALVAAAVASTLLQTAVRVTIDAAHPSLAWTEPLQPMRSVKRYISYAANIAGAGGCAAAAALLQPPWASPAGFLATFSLLVLALLLALAGFLMWAARRAEARRGRLFRRLVDAA